MYDGKVCKFGGSSLASAERINQVADIVLGDESRKIVVVSAFGKENPGDVKVTDQLIGLGNRSSGEFDDSYLQPLREKLYGIARGLGLAEKVAERAMDDLSARLQKPTPDPKQRLDCVKAWGEYASAVFFTNYLGFVRNAYARLVDPKDLFVFSEHFGDATILPESDEKIRSNLNAFDGISIVPGFYGYTKDGAIATLQRGGSDTTGGKLAGVLKADVYENWTDVDNIQRASCVEGALPIEMMTYDEAMELAYMGFGVLKDEAIEPCMAACVPIHVRNTFNPQKEGTWILRHRDPDSYPITGIAYRPGFKSLNIRQVLHSRQRDRSLSQFLLHVEAGATSFGEFPIEHIATGVSNLSFLVSQEYFEPRTVNRLTRHLAEYFQIPASDIVVNYDPLSLISVVGLGMARHHGIIARVSSAIASQGVNIEFVSQGASELSMIFGVNEAAKDSENAKKAVRAIYSEFFVEPVFGRALKLVN